MGPWKHQKTIRAIEAGTTTLRLFQGQLVPGLLQTPEYASAIFSLPPAMPEESRAKTVAARLERQSVLYEPGRSFRFLNCPSPAHRLHLCRVAVSPPPLRSSAQRRMAPARRFISATDRMTG
ncbi:Scr1 family TA system antitoxin-like transcriptional regulator [Streptomyces sp. NPDC002033]|uniref:Scr1 family TA system antitoxin-like transcriptional regulator n=1 Tax=unclassified Streptomyces TaxID=2593676 RepID=UPI00331DCF0B